ncbi:MAG: ABC transporter substrate-binding protein [Lautropia sp.]|nr:ABC transporter substrate-binding protein [Lautropia sp.]
MTRPIAAWLAGSAWPVVFTWVLAACSLLAPSLSAGITLRWAAQSDILTLDPHAQSHTATSAILQHAYEGLVRYDSNFQIEPALAASWTRTSPTEWRFNLRKGVKFHDGAPLTTEDVVFSFERLKEANSSMTSHVNNIKEVRRVDDFTVDLILEKPLPILLRNIVDFRIMSKAWAVRNKSEKAQDLKNKEETFASRNANGTGSYIIRSWAPEQRVVMERNPAWWDTAPGNVDEVMYTPIRQDATRMAALLSGEVDLVTDPPTEDVARLRQNNALRILDGPEIRTIFIGLDQHSEELKYGSVRGRNPFKDIRVRRALHLATDAEAIRRNTMHGLSIPAAILVAPGVNGWSRELDRREPVNLKEAKSLLTEAGYGEGFEFTLDCSNNRYVNDEEICEALVGMWARIGVKARLNAMPFANFIPKLEKFDSSAYLLGWGATTYDALNSLQSLVRTRANSADGSYNMGRISDPRIDALIDGAKSETEPAKREAMVKEALQLTAQNYYYLPIHHQVRPWAMKKSVRTIHKSDDRPETRFAVVSAEAK